jgi:hypothetical protein
MASRWQQVVLGVLVLSSLASGPVTAAILVNARIVGQEFDGTTLTMHLSIQPAGKTAAEALTHAFPGLVANMATSAAIVTYLKQQIASFVSSQPQFGMTVTPPDIALWGGPL